MTATPCPRFDQWLLAQTDREDPVGDIAREFSEDRSVGCAVHIRTPEQLISHIERVHHSIDLAIRAVEQACAEYLREQDLEAEIETQARRIKINRMARQQDAAENWRPPPPE